MPSVTAWRSIPSCTGRPLTNRRRRALVAGELSGNSRKPATTMPSLSALPEPVSGSSGPRARNTWRTRPSRSVPGGQSKVSRPSMVNRNPVAGWARARFFTTSSMWASSVRTDFRNLRRAGMLPNRWRTSMTVPWPQPSWCTACRLP